ncbi:hypothetical protein [Brevundimonas sp.]|uniref:hypothetical protein n=1 Tax=Brevundimonas sp. TaxID=1871086 RepID=UPI0035ADB490
MKRTLVAVIALAMAAPAVSIPATADAQVLTGRGARQAPRRPAITEAELNRLYDAEDEVMELDGRIADIQAAGQAAGGLTEAQQREITTLTRQRNAAQSTVDRLERKRNR